MSFFTFGFFLFFSTLFLFKSFLINQRLVYKSLILLGGLGFYAFFGFNFLLVLLASIIVNYLLIRLIESSESNNNRKFYLVLGILSNLIFLGVFKYYNFFIQSILEATYNLNIQFPSELIIQILAPVGISFFTLRAISHLVDSYKQPLHRDFIDFASYLSFFPHIVAGPLDKAKDFYKDFDNPISTSELNWLGIFRIFRGLFKKLVISSYLYNFVQEPFTNPEAFSSSELLLTTVIYSIYLYTDFSGYSDMAIGLSNLLGFNTKINFNSPFRSASLAEFWNRWHISLSTWIRDYVYIPLGGDGRNKVHWKNLFKWRNLLLAMLLSGIWHGAGWGFLIWGLGHGILLIFEDWFNKILSLLGFNKNSWLKKIKIMTGIVLTFVSVSLLWIPFNIGSWSKLELYISRIFDGNWFEFNILEPRIYIIIFIVLLGNFIPIKEMKIASSLSSLNILIKFLIFLFLTYLIIKLSPDLIPPFVYAGF
jgi:D-alanyl-lipoteichoic acid acyltransferase DltB (MBOAT superfamily)